jgi:hypothetical protein
MAASVPTMASVTLSEISWSWRKNAIRALKALWKILDSFSSLSLLP